MLLISIPINLPFLQTLYEVLLDLALVIEDFKSEDSGGGHVVKNGWIL
jgi:hypothetical protein